MPPHKKDSIPILRRQGYSKRSAAAEFGDVIYRTFMCRDNLLHDGKSQAAAARLLWF